MEIIIICYFLIALFAIYWNSKEDDDNKVRLRYMLTGLFWIIVIIIGLFAILVDKLWNLEFWNKSLFKLKK
jgi:hypothetical protein